MDKLNFHRGGVIAISTVAIFARTIGFQRFDVFEIITIVELVRRLVQRAGVRPIVGC